MQLNNIVDGMVTITLDYLDCYALGEALEHMGGTLAGPHEQRYQLYEAMASAFLAAGMAGDMQGKVVDNDPYTLEAMRAKHIPRSRFSHEIVTKE